MKKLVYTLLISSVMIACNTGPSSKDYKKICEEFDEVAIAQKNILNQIRNKYSGNKDFILRFNQEQINWLQYQDARLRALYPKDWDRFYRKEFGIETFNSCKCQELIRLNKRRNQDLKSYLNTKDDCPTYGNY